jgi:hypothetical protein
MSSLFLGKIGGKNIYEIHVFTKDLPFREYKKSQIADESLFQRMIKGRYKVLESGKPIYCTAINPDTVKKIEVNPHDTREGTIHIAAVDKDGNIEGSLSAAIDIGLKDKGDSVGVPLENRWRSNGYPVGASLDPFREKYARAMYGENRDIRPYEIAELYRHFKRSKHGDLAPRMGLYTGWYHIGVRDAVNKGKTPSTLWLFDAVKEYFNLYKLVGGAVLRDPTIDNSPQIIAPSTKDIKDGVHKGEKALFYKGKMISRPVKTPMPFMEAGTLKFKYEDVPFIDGVVDARLRSETIRKRPLVLSLKEDKGFSFTDRIMLRIGLTVVSKRSFEVDHHPSNHLCRIVNKMALRRAGITTWEFNSIGK